MSDARYDAEALRWAEEYRRTGKVPRSVPPERRKEVGATLAEQAQAAEPADAPPPRTGQDRRREVLEAVAGCVLRDRQAAYADAEDNFARIAAIASVVLARKLAAPLDAADVALFSAAIKMGRLAHNVEHLDSWVDLAGYAVCGAGIVKAGGER